MEKELNYTWDEIFNDWKFLIHRFPIINEKLVVHHIQIDNSKRIDTEFYVLDWMQNKFIESNTEWIKSNSEALVLLGESLDKGKLVRIENLKRRDIVAYGVELAKNKPRSLKYELLKINPEVFLIFGEYLRKGSLIQINNLISSTAAFYGLNFKWIKNKKNNYTGGTERNENTLLFMGESLNNGFWKILKYLINTEDQEMIAAIWIYAFLRGVKRTYGQSCFGEKTENVVRTMEEVIRKFFSGKGIDYHRLRKLLPEICFSQKFIKSIQIEDKSVILELVALAVDYIYRHYKIVFLEFKNPEVDKDVKEETL